MTREILIEAWKLRYPQMDAEKEVDALLGLLKIAGLAVLPRSPTNCNQIATDLGHTDRA